MKYSNLISTTIPPEDMQEILGAIDFINDKLQNLKALTEEERSALPMMHCDTIKFVTQCLNIAKSDPEIVPSDVDVEEIKKDIELVKSIEQLKNPLSNILKKLQDSAMLAESEAYLPSMAIHNAKQHREVNKRSRKKPSFQS